MHQEGTLQRRAVELGALEVRLREVGAVEVPVLEVRSREGGADGARLCKLREGQCRVVERRPAQLGLAEVGADELGGSKRCELEVGGHKGGAHRHCIVESACVEGGLVKHGAREVGGVEAVPLADELIPPHACSSQLPAVRCLQSAGITSCHTSPQAPRPPISPQISPYLSISRQADGRGLSPLPCPVFELLTRLAAAVPSPPLLPA
mmetsp:Transcript_7495/g.24711  ORF Transcript_7495/g.24711 Transcript_7495/m.24711 type:complete len:207 (-) Transcript_7495:76-696(-)